MGPLGVAAAAHQKSKLLRTRLEAEHARAGVLDRNERRAADAAREFFGRRLVFQGNRHFRHNLQCNPAGQLRKALTGFSRAARAAGSRHAANVTAVTMSAIKVSVSGSPGLMPTSSVRMPDITAYDIASPSGRPIASWMMPRRST